MTFNDVLSCKVHDFNDTCIAPERIIIQQIYLYA